MQDRLGELRADLEPIPEEEEPDVESGTVNLPTEEGQDEFMKEFFEEVNSIKGGMATIKTNIHSIEESYGQTLVAINVEQGQKHSEELERSIDSTNLAAADVRNKLKEMNEANKKLKEAERGCAQGRIRINMHGSLTKKFLDLMAEYQEVQTKYKNKYRERVERQYKIVKPNATQDEIDEVLESGNSGQIFAQKILDTEKHAQAKDALAYIENKHKDILKLEQSIKELHQLFLEVAILVEAQGELIDQIEYNVSKSVAYTKQAVQELQAAKKSQKKSRKMMCCMIVIGLIIVIIIVAVGAGVGSKY